MEHEIKKSAEDMSNMRERLLLKDEEHKMLRQTFQVFAVFSLISIMK